MRGYVCSSPKLRCPATRWIISLQLCVDVLGQDHLGGCLISHAKFCPAPAKLRLELVAEQDRRGPLRLNDNRRSRGLDVAAQVALHEGPQGRISSAPGVLHPQRIGLSFTSLHRRPPSPSSSSPGN